MISNKIKPLHKKIGASITDGVKFLSMNIKFYFKLFDDFSINFR